MHNDWLGNWDKTLSTDSQLHQHTEERWLPSNISYLLVWFIDTRSLTNTPTLKDNVTKHNIDIPTHKGRPLSVSYNCGCYSSNTKSAMQNANSTKLLNVFIVDSVFPDLEYIMWCLCGKTCYEMTR